MSQPTSGKAPLKQSIAVAFLLLILLAVTVALSSRLQSPNRDFIEYWSSSKLLVHHANPYDPAAVLKMEQSVGFQFSQALLMANPPSTLFVFAPLGYLPFGIAAAVWEMFLILAALGSIRLLQGYTLGRIPVVAFILASIVDCVLAGQSAIVVLLGVCLFIRLQKTRPYLAGLALTLAMLKPHLLSLFWLVLLLEIVRHRRFQIAAGAIAGLVAASVGILAWNPKIWSHYHGSLESVKLLKGAHPNIASGLRLLVPPHTLWLQFVPLAIGVPLSLWFWWRTRDRWEWHREGALLIAGAVLIAPYSFHVDQVLTLPAVLFCYPRAGKPMQGIFFLLNALAIYLIIRFSMLTSPATMWTSPVFMLWFIWVYRHQRLGSQRLPESAGELAVSQA